MKVEYRVVEGTFDGQRLDRWFKHFYPNINHSFLEKLIRTGQVRVDKKRYKSSKRLSKGQVIRIPPLTEFIDDKKSVGIKQTIYPKELNVFLTILYKDDDYIVFDKPQGIAVQGGSKVRISIDQILDNYKFGYKDKPKLVHRLDKDTSGILLVARTITASRHFSDLLKTQAVKKSYWAIVSGVPKDDYGYSSQKLIKKYINKLGDRVVVDRLGKDAFSVYRKIVTMQGYSWLVLSPFSGRTHQLRVHCADLKMPIVGDKKYGDYNKNLHNISLDLRLQLFARSLNFTTINSKKINVIAPIPDHLKNNFDILGIKPDNFDADNLDYLKKFRII